MSSLGIVSRTLDFCSCYPSYIHSCNKKNEMKTQIFFLYFQNPKIVIQSFKTLIECWLFINSTLISSSDDSL
jgi:hypothetical protein